MYLQLEDEHHLGVGLKDLMKGDETRTMGRGIQYGDLVKRFRSELLGPPSLPQKLGGPLPAAGSLAASPHRCVFTSEEEIHRTLILISHRVCVRAVETYRYTSESIHKV